MNKLKDDVSKLISEELKRANNQYPHFHSAHEAMAVMFEEYQEMIDDLRMVEDQFEVLWNQTKNDENAKDEALLMLDYSVCMIAEAIQLAAMVQKACNMWGNQK